MRERERERERERAALRISAATAEVRFAAARIKLRAFLLAAIASSLSPFLAAAVR